MISTPNHINTVVFESTKQRVLRIAEATRKQYDLVEVDECRVWDVLVPLPEQVDLEALASWLRKRKDRANSVKGNSLLLTDTNGRAGQIAQSLKRNPHKLSVSVRHVLDYFVPPLIAVHLDNLYVQMYPKPDPVLETGRVGGRV